MKSNQFLLPCSNVEKIDEEKDMLSYPSPLIRYKITIKILTCVTLVISWDAVLTICKRPKTDLVI